MSTTITYFNMVGWTETSSSKYTVTDIELKYPIVTDYFVDLSGSPEGSPLFTTPYPPLIKIYKASQQLMAAISAAPLNDTNFQLAPTVNTILGSMYDSVIITASSYSGFGEYGSVGVGLNKGDTLVGVSSTISYYLMSDHINIIGPQPVRG